MEEKENNQRECERLRRLLNTNFGKARVIVRIRYEGRWRRMKNFGDGKEAPCDQGRGLDMLEDWQRKQLTKACFDFAIRVLDGKQVQPQETATLPDILKYLTEG